MRLLRRGSSTLLLLLLILAALPPAPAATAATFVRAAGTRLFGPNGRPLFVLGGNYAGYSDRAWHMWEDGQFDPALVERDFQKARAAGLNSLRIFIREPLPAEVKAGRWHKLDRVVELARRHGLLLLITLYDYRQDNLQEVAAVGRLIAQRYAQETTILGYDLRNEPHLADLLIAQYPPGITPPLLTDTLVKQYGERMPQAEVDAWRQTPEGRGLAPARLSNQQAYWLANNYRLYREFLDEGGRWVGARDWQVTTLDFMDSADADRWRPLLAAIDGTLAAWLAPQVKAIREVDANHLLTVGHSDVVMAKLPANGTLGFQSVHRFPAPGVRSFRLTLDVLDNLRAQFPNHPHVLSEFGYADAEGDPATSALYETGILLHLLAVGAAGGMKWVLNDLASGDSPRENSFGLYRVDDAPKPMVAALVGLADHLRTEPQPGSLALADARALRYIYSGKGVLVLGGQDLQEERATLKAEQPAVVALTWDEGADVRIRADQAAEIRLNGRALLAGADLENRFELKRIEAGTAAEHPFIADGASVRFAVEEGVTYSLKFFRRPIDVRTEVVWPQAGKPVQEATAANITAYVFARGSRQVTCPPGPVRLWRSLNNGVEEEVAVGQRRLESEGNLRFPVWDFNNVDVSAARDPLNKYYFRLTVDGAPAYSNIWSHGVDARTNFPRLDQPTSVGQSAPSAVEARIEIVWPHDNLPVDKATRVNVTAFLFESGTAQAVAPSWGPVVRLWRALNQGQEEPIAVGEKTLRRVGNLTFPAWDFNNVDVAAAREPQNKYYFRVTVDGARSRSNVWSHGADARTYFPQRDVPEGAVTCQ